jgi:6-phosphogluconolactonase
MASAIGVCIVRRGSARLAMSGGHSAERLAADLVQQNVDWNSVELFQVDEREVPPDDADSNWRPLAQLVAEIPDGSAHRMPVEYADADVRYESMLSDEGGHAHVDVVHLGLGPDGHTASLVPGDPAASDDERAVVWSGEYQGHRRLTLTAPVLRAARQVWLVTGAEKADALARLRRHDDSLVATRVITSSAVVIADAASASGTA